MQKWLPVDTYVGGAEHAVLHLLYARFFTKVLNKLGFVNFNEPFVKLRNQGLILGPDGEKMSKSRGNVINPDEVIEQYGADAFRMYEMFMGPLEDSKPWNTQGIIGLSRFLDKVSNLKIVKVLDSTDIHKLIKRITSDISNMKFNTGIAAFMEYLNNHKELSTNDLETFFKLLAPFAPHLTEELWHNLGHETSIHKETWPQHDENLVVDDMVEIVIQIN
jgi:leucyl-tRNA synthetase